MEGRHACAWIWGRDWEVGRVDAGLLPFGLDSFLLGERAQSHLRNEGTRACNPSHVHEPRCPSRTNHKGRWYRTVLLRPA